ncbi:tRNA lysidine(34) synthetase TilS [Omnitrophica bacterium]|nr:tRNA lysidine(34) synthetase TilS [Candidatus Omnitrophota bacterium]
MNMQLYKKVEDTIRRYEMIKSGDRALVGVSGGPDSVFLLKSLYALKDKLGIEICVANLDHGIRGKESRNDSRFVKNLSKALGLKCIHNKVHITKRDLSKKLSTEEILREKRYRFFNETAKMVKADVLATGHTLDDQAETVLMRVIKGSTIKGLSGILPVRKSTGPCVIRPLIDIDKDEILTSLKKSKTPYRLDYTNLDEKFFRNKIRRKILPYLLRYNPRLKRSLSLMAESLREDREFIETEKCKKNFIYEGVGHVSINLKDIIIQPKSLQREILRDAMIKSGGSVKKLTYRHWKDMDNFLKFKRKGQSLDLPGGIIMKRSEKTISLGLRN